MEVQIKGTAQLAAGMRKLSANIVRAAHRDAAMASAHEAAAQVRSQVPRLTGRLAASASATSRGQAAQVALGAGLPYARWIEYGGSRGRARGAGGRYVLPTARRQESPFRERGVTATNKEIRSMSWPTPH